MRIASAAQTLTEKPKMKEIQEKGRANREINMGRQAEWASESQTDRQRAPRRASATKSRAVARAINRRRVVGGGLGCWGGEGAIGYPPGRAPELCFVRKPNSMKERPNCIW